MFENIRFYSSFILKNIAKFSFFWDITVSFSCRIENLQRKKNFFYVKKIYFKCEFLLILECLFLRILQTFEFSTLPHIICLRFLCGNSKKTWSNVRGHVSKTWVLKPLFVPTCLWVSHTRFVARILWRGEGAAMYCCF